MPKEKGIRLDPERGVNPRMTRCAQCGADTLQIALIGDSDHEYHCQNCDVKFLGTAKQRKCPKCKHQTIRHMRRLNEFEKITLGLCPQCEEQKHKMDEEVRAGGIFWRCDYCWATGVLKA